MPIVLQRRYCAGNNKNSGKQIKLADYKKGSLVKQWPFLFTGTELKNQKTGWLNGLMCGGKLIFM